MFADKLYITVCCVVYHKITVVEIVDVATVHRCSAPDYWLKGNSTGCLVKVDFFAINGGVKPREYFIQLLRKNQVHVFLKATFVTLLLKNSHPVNCALCIFKLSTASLIP